MPLGSKRAFGLGFLPPVKSPPSSIHWCLICSTGTSSQLARWIPKRGVVCPVPLNFDNPVTNHIIDHLLKGANMDRVVYIGKRHNNTYAAHASLAHNYRFKYAHVEKEAHMIAYFKGLRETFKNGKTFSFYGMNPDLADHQLQFDSDFECGNLDLAVRTEPYCYDLYLRVDSNTHGHCLWYYFRTKSATNQKVTLSVCNLKTSMTLYNQGYMHPYFKSSKKGDWMQLAASSCTFKSLGYQFLRSRFPRKQISHYCLTFEYSYSEGEEVEFAYCIPYGYSTLLDLLQELRLAANVQGQNLQVDNLCESLSGMDIPIVTFGKGKQQVLVTARTHPGETCSSWIADGLLR